MTRAEVRFECLRLAISLGFKGDGAREVVEAATVFEEFIGTDKAKPWEAAGISDEHGIGGRRSIPMGHHEKLEAACRETVGDYDPWGQVIRWKDPDKTYPDCSCGCRWFYPLRRRGKEPIGMDWGVCANPKSHRCGLLTFEHQGCLAFESDKAA